MLELTSCLCDRRQTMREVSVGLDFIQLSLPRYLSTSYIYFSVNYLWKYQIKREILTI